MLHHHLQNYARVLLPVNLEVNGVQNLFYGTPVPYVRFTHMKNLDLTQIEYPVFFPGKGQRETFFDVNWATLFTLVNILWDFNLLFLS